MTLGKDTRMLMITVCRQCQLENISPLVNNGITWASHELLNNGNSSRHTPSDFLVLNPTYWKGTLSVCVCVYV